MSTADAFASSPKVTRMDSYSIVSSSPEFPSLTDIFVMNTKGPDFRSGSNATAIPAHATHTFTNATDLLGDAPETDLNTGSIARSPPLKPKTVNGLMRRRVEDVQVQTSVRKEAPIPIKSSPERPWLKFKSKTPTPEDKQPPIQKGRVTKSMAKDQPKKTNQSRAKPETVSRHFPSKTEVPPARKQTQKEMPVGTYEIVGPPSMGLEATVPDDTNAPSCAEPALRRRVDWTPPPADTAIVIASDSDHRELPSSVDRPRASEEVFLRLSDKYARKSDSVSISSEQQKPELKKRKRIELMSVTGEQPKQPAQAKETSPSKPVTVKKKTRTITELATAPYIVPEPELDLSKRSTRDSLLEYFDTGGEVKALVEYQSVVMSKNKETAKPAKTKARAKPRKKKAGGAEDPILLSPNSALKQSSNQDFVFGTSSQLLGDESPTTLRQLQLAIQASNYDDDPFGASDSRGLWRASARDIDGDLMDVDVVDLVQTPALPDKHRSVDTVSTGNTQPPDLLPSDDFVDIDTIGLDTPRPEKLVPSQNNSPFLPRPQAPTPPYSNATISATNSAPVPDAAAPRPKYETFTDAQLAKQIGAYGFKPVKKRQTMISLLDQCWASKNPGATSVPSQSFSTTTVDSASPKGKGKGKGKAAIPTPPSVTEQANSKPEKRPPGRPKKNTETAAASSSKSTTTAKKTKETTPKKPRAKPKSPARKAKVIIADSENSDLEEEDDEDGPMARSPSRLSAGSLTGSDADEDEDEATAAVAGPTEDPLEMSLSLSLTPTDQDLFRHITRAVKAQPRARTTARPSWQEKMLMYDPVVLEDLAAWLNGGPLTKAGWDGEVNPTDVKRWCEARSVVCMWRQTRRGKERARV